AAIAVAATTRRRVQRLHRDWQIRAALVAPAARRGSLSEEEIASWLLDIGDWVIVLTGGDHTPGTFDGLDLCPSHHCYNVATNRIALAGFPNPAQIPGMLAYPADPPADDRCPGECLHHMTHHWKGWYVMLNTKTGAFFLDCNSFAQYHCILPNDPGRNDPPADGPPKPEA